MHKPSYAYIIRLEAGIVGVEPAITINMAGVYFIEPFSVDELGSISAL